ncbi:MAG: hypothetical protein HRU20_13845 [Pseudomonadales bacterium]|nr:hypothetical protein [Pseudomonadales bacterium]
MSSTLVLTGCIESTENSEESEVQEQLPADNDNDEASNQEQGSGANSNNAQSDDTASNVEDGSVAVLKPAELTLPALNTLLSDANIVFKSNQQGKQWLDIGHTAGAQDIFNGAFNGELNVANIPQDGSTVYITLWTLIDKQWLTQKYQFITVDKTSIDEDIADGNVGDGQKLDDNDSISNNTDSQGWTWVDVPSTGPYGSHTFKVPAAQNWVNSGLYLVKGQSATVSSSGSWRVKGGVKYGPEGKTGVDSRGCQEGELTARLGLYYKDAQIHCVGSNGSFTADKEGIVYLGAVVSNDLGETYEARNNAIGALQVTVTSQGDTVPTISKAMAAYYDLDQVTSGWVEIRSEHNILTLPLATAKQDQSRLQAAIQRLDDIYLSHQKLRLIRPYHGQAIRWFPDTTDAPGWMLAGNPIRMDPKLVAANSSERITLAAEVDNGDWGFAHELGHNFNFSGGDWYYTSSTAGLETWPNIFSVYAQESLGLPQRDVDCPTLSANYKATGQYSVDFKDPWVSLCFLLEFKDRYGWEFYQDFYREFNISPTSGWTNIHDRFEKSAGEDITPIFNAWKIPL